MLQTNNTAIVLRHANYRDNDRMLTLFSPTRGKLEVMSRGCRKPKSPLLSASELFALGDFELYEKAGRLTLVNATLTESFYPLRTDYDRLSVGVYLLNLCELVIQPGENAQELFMLLLHTLSRLTFTAQPWRPLISGFLLHFAACEGRKPRLNHCVRCGKSMLDASSALFDHEDGGLCCQACREAELQLMRQTKRPPTPPGRLSIVTRAEMDWMRMALQSGSASWVDSAEQYAPYKLLRQYVEQALDQPVRSADMLPKD